MVMNLFVMLSTQPYDFQRLRVIGMVGFKPPVAITCVLFAMRWLRHESVS